MAWSNGNGRTSTARWKRIRQRAKASLPYWCARCGAGEPLELDHIINHARGGTAREVQATTQATTDLKPFY